LQSATPGVVERLEGHAGRHGAVTNDGNGVAVFALDFGGQGHAQRGRDGGAGMRGAKGVVFALGALGKPAQAAQLAQVAMRSRRPVRILCG
jgi:hypothetical protein